MAAHHATLLFLPWMVMAVALRLALTRQAQADFTAQHTG